MKGLTKILSAAVLLLGFVAVPNAHALTLVDLELSLLVDVSGSIDTTEFNLQKNGYASAFTNASIINAIIAGTGVHHSIAVNLVYWSGNAQQSQVVGWTLINDATSSIAFANAINATTQLFSGNTAPGSAINFDVPLFGTNLYEGDKKIIDVSGDGEQNDGANTATARNNAAAAGFTINGLAIGNTSLVAWYTANIKTTDGFVLQASTFNDFGTAVNQKILQEVTPGPVIPEPATMLLMGSGLFGTVFLRRKQA